MALAVKSVRGEENGGVAICSGSFKGWYNAVVYRLLIRCDKIYLRSRKIIRQIKERNLGSGDR